MTLAAQIRTLEEAHMAALAGEGALGPRVKHQDRLERQARGAVVYLVAWERDRPVGHVLVKWAGAQEEPVASGLQACPDLEDLLVVPDRRSQGTGSRLLVRAEELALARGYRQVGLSVGLTETAVRSWYERLGYHDAGLGSYWERGDYVDEHGRRHQWEEEVRYLVKQLPGGGTFREPGRAVPPPQVVGRGNRGPARTDRADEAEPGTASG
jgi:GNAT superfamily N-acetyltransferase